MGQKDLSLDEMIQLAKKVDCWESRFGISSRGYCGSLSNDVDVYVYKRARVGRFVEFFFILEPFMPMDLFGIKVYDKTLKAFAGKFEAKHHDKIRQIYNLAESESKQAKRCMKEYSEGQKKEKRDASAERVRKTLIR